MKLSAFRQILSAVGLVLLVFLPLVILSAGGIAAIFDHFAAVAAIMGLGAGLVIAVLVSLVCDDNKGPCDYPA